MSETWHGGEIAIIGRAGRFPDAPDVATLWRNTRAGHRAVRTLTPAQLQAAGESAARQALPGYVPAAAMLEGIDRFDAAFFRISPRDAALMDPQHRHLLETAWAAMEDAGYDPARVPGAVGVFAGSGMSVYLPLNLLTNPALMEELGLFYVRHAGNDKDFLATRLSYALDLRGPSVSVQAGDATSLVAVHMACQSLLAHECDVALAGGVTIDLPHGRGYVARPGSGLSPGGQCRPFDDHADGTVYASGAGLVVLRRLDDALRDGDAVRAIILGSATAHAGHHDHTTRRDTQVAVMQAALDLAAVSASSVDLLMANGAATTGADGDEAGALAEVFADADGRPRTLAAVSHGLGDLGAAAGVASLLVAADALTAAELPPLPIDTPSTSIDWPRLRTEPLPEATPWSTGRSPRRAGVTAIDAGGTHSHVVMQEAPAPPPSAPSRPWQLLTWSARTQDALGRATVALAERLGDATLPLPDAAFTLATGRRAFTQRRAVVVTSAQDAQAVLSGDEAARLAAGDAATPPRVVFMFPGGGAQYPGMARELYEREPVFREALDQCFAVLSSLGAGEVRAAIMASPDDTDAAAAQLRDHATLSLPAIFSVSYSLAHLLRSWGIVPAACTGHSLGEYVAACLAGVWSLPDALSLVVTRGRLFDRLPDGAMLSVAAPLADVTPHLDAALSVAAVNSVSNTVVSGRRDAVEALALRLTAAAIEHRRLPIRVAAHSAELAPILDEFRAAVQTVQRRPPTLPFISNVTGTWIAAADAVDPEYWVRHLRSTVRFADGLTTVLAEPCVLVELGPGAPLSSLVRQHPVAASATAVLSTLHHAKEADSDQRTVLDTIGRLWTLGVEVDWTAFYAAEARRRVSLPTYPFSGDRHWVEPGRGIVSVDAATAAIVRPDGVEQRLARDVWTPRPATSQSSPVDSWIVVRGTSVLGEAVADALAATGRTVRVVSGEDLRTELAAVPMAAVLGVVDARPLEAVLEATGVGVAVEDGAVAQFARGRDLIQALYDAGLAERTRLWFVGAAFEPAAGQPVHCSDVAALRGLALVAPVEMPGLLVATLDVGLAVEATRPATAAAVVAAVTAGAWAPRLALRDGVCLAHAVAWGLDPAPAGAASFRDRGSYFITGGLGGVAGVVARYLAQHHRARLTLVSRRGAATPGADRAAQDLEALGAEVVLVAADVGDSDAMRAAVTVSRSRFGRIDGVIHAAGLLQPRLISQLDRAAVEQSLHAKCRGARVLDDVLADDPPDLVVWFSSISARTGIAGQAAYAAANAVLDAWAYVPAATGQRRLALAFGPWQATGMTAPAPAAAAAAASGHPLLGERQDDGADRSVFATTYRADALWVLAEHVVRGGPAVLPGAAAFEMIWAAVAHGAATPAAGMAVVIDDLWFVEPLTLARDGAVPVRVTVHHAVDGSSVYRLESQASGHAWLEHVTARVSAAVAPVAEPLASIRQRCRQERGLDSTAPLRHQQRVMEFGPRWQAAVHALYGDDEVLAVITAPAAAAADAGYAWHPALMDVAITAGLALAHGDADPALAVWVPASCERVVLLSPPRGTVIAHAARRRDAAADGTAVFDVTLYHEAGHVLARLVGLRMRRVDASRVLDAPAPRRTADDPVSALARVHGLRADEGVHGLVRAVSSVAGTVVLSSIDVDGLAAHLAARSSGGAPSGTPGRATRSGQLRSDYVAPRSPVEQHLAEIWARQLGIDRVGVNDNFFELGGESLIGLRLFGEIRRAFGVALPVDTLFTAPTIAALAPTLAPTGTSATGEPSSAPTVSRRSPLIVPIQKGGRRPVLYCVHDQNGYVLLYRDLARRLGSEQPFHAIQAFGLDQPAAADRSVEAMASRYVAEIRAAGPGPYWLSGSSLGGIVAFEMAQQLTAAGEQVAFLGLFDSWTPADLRRWWFGTSEAGWERAARHLREFVTQGPTAYAETRRRNRESWSEYQRRAAEEAERSHRLGEAVAAHLRDGSPMPDEVLTFHLEQIYGEAYRNYDAAPYAGTVTLFRADERANERDAHPSLGWSDVRLGGLEVVPVPGAHGFMVREPHVAELAEALTARLARAAEVLGQARR